MTELQVVVGQINEAFAPGPAEGVQLEALAASLSLSRLDTSAGAIVTDEVFRDFIQNKLVQWSWDHLDSEADCVMATIAENLPEEENVEIKDLTEVPDSLSGIYKTFSELENAMLLKLEIHGKPVEKDHVVFLDVELLVSFDGGKTWTKATEDNFPPEGVTATLPYPAGTNAEDYDFAVSHMFTLNSEKMKTKAGNVENCPATKTAKGLQVTLHGLSPVAIAWAEKNEPTPTPTPEPTATPTATPTPAPTPTAAPTATPTVKPTAAPKPLPKTGDEAPLALWLGLVLAGTICFGVIVAMQRRRRKKR